jgi:GDPmannose 4,6-dehydratase
MKTAIITGVNGQDGSYLAELLLGKGYKVIGLHRHSANLNLENLSEVRDHENFSWECVDITDPSSIFSCISKHQPDELYNLAAQSFVKVSFDQPSTTFEANCVGVVNILEAVKKSCPTCRVYQASTSEMFGKNYSSGFVDSNWNTKYQNEDTPFVPQSPYGVAKLAAHHMCRLYREGYGMFVCCGILFNHESPRRGHQFVTRKITNYVGELANAKDPKNFRKLELGNLDAQRDWGHARDYVEAMWLMLQHSIPDDYVVSTGKSHTIKELLEKSFGCIGEKWEDHVIINDIYKRPSEVDFLLGDSSKIRNTLKWAPKTTFGMLVVEMVANDIRRYDR